MKHISNYLSFKESYSWTVTPIQKKIKRIMDTIGPNIIKVLDGQISGFVLYEGFLFDFGLTDIQGNHGSIIISLTGPDVEIPGYDSDNFKAFIHEGDIEYIEDYLNDFLNKLHSNYDIEVIEKIKEYQESVILEIGIGGTSSFFHDN